MAGRNQPPDRLPPEIRDHSEVVRACREWNIGRLFRVVNNLSEEPAKLTVTHIGRLCGLSVSRVGEYMRDAHRVTTVGIIERITDGLHIPGERFGLAPRPWENEGNEAAATAPARNVPASATAQWIAALDRLVQLFPLLQRGDEDGEEAMERMERRALIMQSSAVLAGLSMSMVGGGAALEAVRHELNRSVADEPRAAEVEEWRAIALDYGQTYLVTAPATLLPTLLVDLHGVRRAMRRHPGESEQRELVRAGALLAAFTALTVANLGDLDGARRWWRSARRAADESADPFTRSWVRGREVAQHEHRPVPATLQLVDEAQARLDEAPPAVLPQFLSGKAQALALAGRHGEAERALGRLRECAGTFVGSNRDSLFDFAEANLRYTESAVYSHAGNFAKAEQAQQSALALYADSSLRGPAQVELHRALCLVRSGDPAQGAGHAQAVITGLPVMHRVRPVADLGQKVFSAIPVNERRRSWALEYRECLESALPGEGAGHAAPGTPRA